MARRRAATVYKNGDITLGWSGDKAYADFTDASTGKRKRVKLSGPGEILTADQARAALDRFANARKLVLAQQARPTIGALWQMWLADRAEDGFDNSIYRANWVSLKLTFGAMDPEVISAGDCRAYARRRFEAGRAPATVHTELVRLRHCLTWAAKRRLISFAPDVWVPSRGQARDRVISMSEARRLLTAAQEQGDPHVALFIILAITTGARHTAILDLTCDRIDFANGLIQYDDDLRPNPMHKTWRKGRATVPMNVLARAALEVAHSARLTDHVIEHGGRRLKTVRSGFANAVVRAGLPGKVTPHTLRHSVSTWLKEQGIDMEKRAQLLGHSDSRTTDVHYSHADPATYLSGVVKMLDAGIEPGRGK